MYDFVSGVHTSMVDALVLSVISLLTSLNPSSDEEFLYLLRLSYVWMSITAEYQKLDYILDLCEFLFSNVMKFVGKKVFLRITEP